MDNNFQTSFIPKKPLVGTQVVSSGPSINLFTLIGIVIFIVSIVAAVGVFLWQKALEARVESNKAALEKTKESFDPSLIDQLKKLNDRIDASKTLLANHIALSSFFDVIESLTLKSVRFKTLAYTVGAKDITISMKGEAADFSAVALQSDVFGKTKALVDPILSNLTILPNGNVGFDFNATIPRSILLYKNLPTPAVTTSTSTILNTTTTNTTSTTPAAGPFNQPQQ